jgi:hypothetical protein
LKPAGGPLAPVHPCTPPGCCGAGEGCPASCGGCQPVEMTPCTLHPPPPAAGAGGERERGGDGQERRAAGGAHSSSCRLRRRRSTPQADAGQPGGDHAGGWVGGWGAQPRAWCQQRAAGGGLLAPAAGAGGTSGRTSARGRCAAEGCPRGSAAAAAAAAPWPGRPHRLPGRQLQRRLVHVSPTCGKAGGRCLAGRASARVRACGAARPPPPPLLFLRTTTA